MMTLESRKESRTDGKLWEPLSIAIAHCQQKLSDQIFHHHHCHCHCPHHHCHHHHHCHCHHYYHQHQPDKIGYNITPKYAKYLSKALNLEHWTALSNFSAIFFQFKLHTYWDYWDIKHTLRGTNILGDRLCKDLRNTDSIVTGFANVKIFCDNIETIFWGTVLWQVCQMWSGSRRRCWCIFHSIFCGPMIFLSFGQISQFLSLFLSIFCQIPDLVQIFTNSWGKTPFPHLPNLCPICQICANFRCIFPPAPPLILTFHDVPLSFPSI